MSKRIKPLPSLEALNAHFIFDAERGELIWRDGPANKYLNKRYIGARAGFVSEKGYLRVKVCGETHMVHRIIFKMHNKREPVGEVDHENLDSLDNLPGNLREATSAQNTWNKSNKRRVRSDLPKGVCFHRRSGRYRARIQKQGRRHELGDYKSVEDAAKAYAMASNTLHGRFGRVA